MQFQFSQGPFRSPRDVQKQRYKPFKPTLRVETSYTSIEEARQKMKDEEWIARLSDDMYVLINVTVYYSISPHSFE